MSEITWGDWKLIPVDDLNWELAHNHVNTKGKNIGRATWHRLGKYYQHNTIANALWYAADYDLKNGTEDLELKDAIREYESITDRMVAEIREMLNG